MANQLQLQRQIQEEIDREAKIDKAIDRILKRILKTPKYKHYHIINERQNADALIIFKRYDLIFYNVILNDNKKNDFIDFVITDSNFKVFYLKNKNTHDAKRATYGDIKEIASIKKSYN